jgi:hypothetical protein
MEAHTQPHVNVLQVRSLAESTGEVGLATPSLAVQMVGLNSVPTAGDEFYVCADETMARKAAEVAEDAQVPPQIAGTTYSTVVRITILCIAQGGQPMLLPQPECVLAHRSKTCFDRWLQRMERLAASAGGGNIVTTKSWASMDDDTETLQRLNVILKVNVAVVSCFVCLTRKYNLSHLG